MRLAKSDEEIAERLCDYLKTKIAEGGLTYAELAERMKKHGRPNENATTIKSKLYRGTFSATFFVAVIAALGMSRIDIKEI